MLFVRDSDSRNLKDLIRDSPLAKSCEVYSVKEFSEEIRAEKNNKNLLKHRLNEFDLLLIDARINIAKAAKELGTGVQGLVRKRLFPFPVKLAGESSGAMTQSLLVERIRKTVENSTHLLLQGGKVFTLALAKTESLSIKE